MRNVQALEILYQTLSLISFHLVTYEMKIVWLWCSNETWM